MRSNDTRMDRQQERKERRAALRKDGSLSTSDEMARDAVQFDRDRECREQQAREFTTNTVGGRY